jgi:drug/metabolite transporter (DMT)-like permease
VVIGLVLFAILGLTMGYTVPGRGAWLALVAPVAFAIVTLVSTGLDGSQVVAVILALVITAVAVLAGKVLDGQFTRGRERPSS